MKSRALNNYPIVQILKCNRSATSECDVVPNDATPIRCIEDKRGIIMKNQIMRMKMKTKYNGLTIIIFSVLITTMLFAQSDVPKRVDIKDEFKWNLSDIYPTIEEWEKDFNFIESNLAKLEQYRGQLGKSGETILRYFKLNEKISIALENIYAYAYFKKDLDTRVSEDQGLFDRAGMLFTKYGESTAFVEPEFASEPAPGSVKQ